MIGVCNFNNNLHFIVLLNSLFVIICIHINDRDVLSSAYFFLPVWKNDNHFLSDPVFLLISKIVGGRVSEGSGPDFRKLS